MDCWKDMFFLLNNIRLFPRVKLSEPMKVEIEKGMTTALLRLCVLLLMIYCYSLGVCMAMNNGSTIAGTLSDSEEIVSSDQSFKLGFFSPPNTTNRYVGIMFNLPVLTVIWVANRNKPLNDSTGTFTISEDGNLVVLNGQEQVLWSSGVLNLSANSTAQLLDTGNLVLQENGRTVWESFQYPTDSWVNNMRISAASATDEKRQLSSWRSPSDPSSGDFSAGVNVSQISQLLIWNRSKLIWRSGPWNGIVFIGLAVMNSVYNNGVQFVNDGTGASYLTLSYSNDLGLIYYQLSSEGIILEKLWNERERDWQVTSTIEASCLGYGNCGPFGNCDSQGTSSKCTCLEGFEPKDKEEWRKGNWTGGCTRKKMLQCERNRTSEDGFLRLSHMKVPNFPNLASIDEDSCDNTCSNDCSCIAYAFYKGLGCMHWSGNLIDATQLPEGGADLYIRLPRSELGSSNKGINAVIASTVVAGSLVFAGCGYVFWKFLARLKGKKDEYEESLFEDMEKYQMGSGQSSDLNCVKLEELPLYSYELLLNATDNFHSTNKLGKGGFGEVYKGKLPDGKEIAVKRLSKTSSQGTNEFMNEVLLISKLQHRNLVRLLGCCVGRGEKMLIYEYMPNGSLDTYLFDSPKQDSVDWRRRALIIEGIGRGLLYLHRDSRLKIIHRDLKASNILLDEELNPKISDFGLARILGGKQDQDKTIRVVGTYGYMSPEYAMVGRFSEKSDVYSFGVLLLEILTGRKNSRFSAGEDELSLIRYAWKLWNERDDDVAKQITYPSIYEESIEMEIKRYIQVGLLCVQEHENDRPNVSAILSMLNSEISELPSPRLPAFTGPHVTTSLRSQSPNTDYTVNDYTVTVVEAR